jgi:hypothetical protein
MDQFISIIIFTLPGLLTYFWLQMFGLNPTIKHTPTEMLGISALLCLPISFFIIITYNLGFFITDKFILLLNYDFTLLELKYIKSIDDLNSLSINILFLFFYVLLSIGFSFLLSWIWSIYIFKYLMIVINRVRVKRKISKLSEDPSVWDSFFSKLEEQSESPLIVELYKIDKPEVKVRGSVTRFSRPFETERAFIIETEELDKALEYYEYPIKRVYVDTKSGIIINELNQHKPVVKD